jgi:hypothetical protein
VVTTAPSPYVTVPRAWDGDTAVVIASGPSLTQADVAHCRDRARLIAVKDAVQWVPFADCLYGCDATFWTRHRGWPDCRSVKYSIDPRAAGHGPSLLRNTGESGLELDPSGVRTGRNSTYQAVNVAVHYGVRRILLLGVDMGHTPHGNKYFFGNRPHHQQVVSPWHAMLLVWPTLVAPLAAAGVTLINCSRQTAIDCFPRVALEEALP